ncbi:MAG TPA: prolyl-tRNA synthetase associated domain-containing protein [Bacteroidales bacterium]
MNGDLRLYEILDQLHISYDYYEHPPVPTIEDAMPYWKDIDATHCKNLFFRNHKGDKHYLVILNHIKQLDIHDLEKRLKQGKISFASEQRMARYLGIKPGSVSPFGLINDTNKHVYVFLDANLQKSQKISFHPNLNTADIVIQFVDLIKFLDWTGNQYEFLQLYDE